MINIDTYMFLMILSVFLVLLVSAGTALNRPTPEIAVKDVLQPVVGEHKIEDNKLIAPANLGVKP